MAKLEYAYPEERIATTQPGLAWQNGLERQAKRQLQSLSP